MGNAESKTGSNPNAKFRAKVLLAGKTATGVEVPTDVVERLGTSKHPPVRVSINGHTYRSSIASMRGKYMLGISAEQRKHTGVKAGDTIDVNVELDTAPREVTVPTDFAAALSRDKKAKAFFESMSYSNKSRHVLAIEGAKTEETRARRIAKAVATLHEERAV